MYRDLSGIYLNKTEQLIKRYIFSLTFNALIPVSFSLVEAPLEVLFWYGEKIHRRIFMSSMSLNLTPEMNSY